MWNVLGIESLSDLPGTFRAPCAFARVERKGFAFRFWAEQAKKKKRAEAFQLQPFNVIWDSLQDRQVDYHTLHGRHLSASLTFYRVCVLSIYREPAYCEVQSICWTRTQYIFLRLERS